MYIRQPEPPTLAFEGELFVIDAQQVQQRSLEIVDVYRIFGDVVAKIVGFAVGDTRVSLPLRPSTS